ncbi:MAG: hypothetical protein Q9226_004162 [Calogaya cf. arnoldii]
MGDSHPTRKPMARSKLGTAPIKLPNQKNTIIRQEPEDEAMADVPPVHKDTPREPKGKGKAKDEQETEDQPLSEQLFDENQPKIRNDWEKANLRRERPKTASAAQKGFGAAPPDLPRRIKKDLEDEAMDDVPQNLEAPLKNPMHREDANDENETSQKQRATRKEQQQIEERRPRQDNQIPEDNAMISLEQPRSANHQAIPVRQTTSHADATESERVCGSLAPTIYNNHSLNKTGRPANFILAFPMGSPGQNLGKHRASEKEVFHLQTCETSHYIALRNAMSNIEELLEIIGILKTNVQGKTEVPYSEMLERQIEWAFERVVNHTQWLNDVRVAIVQSFVEGEFEAKGIASKAQTIVPSLNPLFATILTELMPRKEGRIQWEPANRLGMQTLLDKAPEVKASMQGWKADSDHEWSLMKQYASNVWRKVAARDEWIQPFFGPRDS